MSQYDDEINEIRTGFEMFDIENKGQIDPFELKETMEEMNLKDKNPFIYDLISYICSRKDIKSKGGLTLNEFISLLEDKISDVESKQGIKAIFEVFSDLDNKVAMPSFYQVAKEVGDEDGCAEIRDLVEKSKTGGKEIDFNEFYDIMKEKNTSLKYNLYSHKRSKSGNSIRSKSKGKSSGKKEYDSEFEYSFRNKNTPKSGEKNPEQKSGLIIVEKRATEKINDSPTKVNRYQYRFDKDDKLKDNDNKIEIKNNYTYQNKRRNIYEEILNNEINEGKGSKKINKRFGENQIKLKETNYINLKNNYRELSYNKYNSYNYI